MESNLLFNHLRRFVKIAIVGSTRGVMSSSVRLEKALENLQKNPYYDKYSERIAALQKSSPDEFLRRIGKREEPSRNLTAPDVRQFSSVLNPKESIDSNVPSEDKKLDSILRMELVKDKSALEIQSIWEEYHLNKDVISAIIPSAQYEAMRARALQHPTFLFPLPRAHGYEFILCQSSGHQLHFTPLLAYQVHKENAPECLTVVHYPELRDKGLILMRGHLDEKVLTVKEAQCLANQYQLYYGGQDEARTHLLRTFTETPSAFRHTDLIAQLEHITLT